MEDNGPLLSGTNKREKSSVTTRMLADRDAQIDAEQISGQQSVWRDVPGHHVVTRGNIAGKIQKEKNILD